MSVAEPAGEGMRLTHTQRRPHLGFYCPGNGSGGPWRYVHSVLGGLNPDEFDVTVFCYLPGAYEPRAGVEVVSLKGGTGLNVPTLPAPATARGDGAGPGFRRLVPKWLRLWAGFLKESWNLARLLRQHPVDLFHTQNTGCEESPVAARLAGFPRVLGTFHVNSSLDLHRVRSGPAHRVLEHVSNRCLDAAIAVSKATRQDWVSRTHLPPRRVLTIHNGIDPDRFRRRQSKKDARRQLGLPEGAVIVGGLGRLDEVKGFDDLLDATARLRPEFPDLFVAIAGSGPLREHLQAQADRLGVSDRVRFLGFLSDVQVPLDALDLFAIPSRCEALPYALLEAMAAELPVVGAAVGGIPEVIAEGVTGFVVPPRNADRLAAGLRPVLKDADLRTRLGTAGRARVIREFHEQDMVRKTVEVYRDMLRRGEPRGAGRPARPGARRPERFRPADANVGWVGAR